MKTPLQELIGYMNGEDSTVVPFVDEKVLKKATELLEKERNVKKTVEERAEEEYPLIAAEGFGGANAIIMRQREAYIKGAMEHQNK